MKDKTFFKFFVITGAVSIHQPSKASSLSYHSKDTRATSQGNITPLTILIFFYLLESPGIQNQTRLHKAGNCLKISGYEILEEQILLFPSRWQTGVWEPVRHRGPILFPLVEKKGYVCPDLLLIPGSEVWLGDTGRYFNLIKKKMI
jgi:hypothetical protein